MTAATPADELPREPMTQDPAVRAQWLVSLGDAHLGRGAIVEACRSYEEAVRLLPAWWIARFDYVKCGRLLGVGRERLEENLREAIRSYPKGAMLYLQLGFVAEDYGDSAKAREAYEQAVRLAPWRADARFRLAEMDLSDGDLEGAAAALSALVEVAPDNVVARNRLADVYLKLGRPADAAQQLEVVARRSRYVSTALVRLERIYAEIGPPDALARVRRALDQR